MDWYSFDSVKDKSRVQVLAREQSDRLSIDNPSIMNSKSSSGRDSSLHPSTAVDCSTLGDEVVEGNILASGKWVSAGAESAELALV
jgi:hypothetical protein